MFIYPVLPSERLGVPPTMPDVDIKVAAAEATSTENPKHTMIGKQMVKAWIQTDILLCIQNGTDQDPVDRIVIKMPDAHSAMKILELLDTSLDVIVLR